MGRTSSENKIYELYDNFLGFDVENYYPTEPCVYFLYRGKTVVYVGQALDRFSRIRQHQRDREKDFDHAKFVRVPAVWMDEVECMMIEAFDPEYNNNAGNHNPEVAKLPKLWKESLDNEEEAGLLFEMGGEEEDVAPTLEEKE